MNRTTQAMRRITPAMLPAALAAAAAAASPDHAYAGPEGYALRYPAGWTRVAPQARGLLIVSRGRLAQGPVIGRGQAAILVRALGEGETVPVATVRQDRRATSSGACATRLALETEERSAPGLVETGREIYCTGGPRTIVVQLVHWRDDRRAPAYRAAQDAVADGLRFQGGRP
jgi:hypothetical protein